jgi:excisionase family DNA binding protein
MMMNVDDEKPDSQRIERSRRNSSSAISSLTPVFNTSEACHYLRISRPTFLKLIATGKIRAKKLGKGWKVLDSELERLLLPGELTQP